MYVTTYINTAVILVAALPGEAILTILVTPCITFLSENDALRASL